MSQEKAQEFIRKVGTERHLWRILDNLKSKDDLLEVAQSLGYTFSVEELKLAIVQIMDLQDEDLESVVGGVRGGFGYGTVLSLVNLLGTENFG
ncbi:MAG: Nif11-like leader peptide family natural product precursor [Synergistaceae bacterium]|nr:Nif11-like leader peptide family natural product precursor [Synergistaceae bacterium]